MLAILGGFQFSRTSTYRVLPGGQARTPTRGHAPSCRDRWGLSPTRWDSPSQLPFTSLGLLPRALLVVGPSHILPFRTVLHPPAQGTTGEPSGSAARLASSQLDASAVSGMEELAQRGSDRWVVAFMLLPTTRGQGACVVVVRGGPGTGCPPHARLGHLGVPILRWAAWTPLSGTCHRLRGPWAGCGCWGVRSAWPSAHARPITCV